MSIDEEDEVTGHIGGTAGGLDKLEQRKAELPNQVPMAASAPGCGDSRPWGWPEGPGATEPWDSASNCHGKGLQAVN